MKKVIFLALALVVLISCGNAQDQKIRLIVRGDDIGSFHAANVANIDAYKEGIMTVTEIMVPCPWFEEAAILLNENPGLDVGIHVALTSEWENYKWRPLTKGKSISTPEGYFYPMIWKRDDMAEGHSLRDADWSIEDIEAEMRAQIELAVSKIPHISHVTCHMGCSGWDEDVQALWNKLAEEYNLVINPADYNVERAKVEGWKEAKNLDEKVDAYIKMLEGLTAGTYLYVEHPAYDTQEMKTVGHVGYYGVATDRDLVTKVLIDPRVKAKVEELGIELISYKDLVQ